MIMADGDGSQRNKYLLLGLLMAGGLGYLGYEYAYRPIATELAELEERLEDLETQNRTARIITEQDGQDSVERRLAWYSQQLAQVERLVPTSEELPDLLDAISVEAQRSGVEIALIQPVGAVAENYYTRRTYALAVLGGYHQIGEFLTRVGSLPRIVTPVNLNLMVRDEETRTGSPQLEARFAIETYVLPAASEASSAAAR
jgi:type IV pilus assembly protein PilO